MTDNLSEPISLPPVVVIDDDSDDIELLQSIARKLQILNELIFFTSSSQALAFLQRTLQAPAAIVCDVNMPKISGIELRSRLLNTMPRFGDVPFFFLSSSKTESDARSAESLRVTGFFEKTSSVEGLKKAFHSILVSAGVLS